VKKLPELPLKRIILEQKKMCETFAPLIKQNGRLVIISSIVGRLLLIKDDNKRKQFSDDTLTPERIDELANQFIQSVKSGTYAQEGFPRSCYGMSKVTINAYTRYLIRNTSQLFNPGVKVYAVSPGYCNTSMTSFRGPRPAEKGAETPVWLACQSPNIEITPGFYEDKVRLDW